MKVHVEEPLPRLREHVRTLVREAGHEVASLDDCDVVLLWHDAREDGWSDHVALVDGVVDVPVLMTSSDGTRGLKRPFTADALRSFLGGHASANLGGALSEPPPRGAIVPHAADSADDEEILVDDEEFIVAEAVVAGAAADESAPMGADAVHPTTETPSRHPLHAALVQGVGAWLDSDRAESLDALIGRILAERG